MELFSSWVLTESNRIEAVTELHRSLTFLARCGAAEVTPLSYPVLEIDWLKHPDLADNIWHAQMTGRPRVLTYNGPFIGLQNRKDAMHFELDGIRQEILHILSRDEYPFACTVEGGGGSWVGHIPARQNSAQGGLIAAFLRANGIIPSNGNANLEKSKFEVRVANHPRGQVVINMSRP